MSEVDGSQDVGQGVNVGAERTEDLGDRATRFEEERNLKKSGQVKSSGTGYFGDSNRNGGSVIAGTMVTPSCDDYGKLLNLSNTF